jgi:hypothetical protein
MAENQTQNVPQIVQNAMVAQQIKMEDVNLVLPTQNFGAILGQFDKVTMELLKVDPNPKGSDVYQLEGKLQLRKGPLLAMGDALNLQWDPDRTGLTTPPGADIAHAKAVAAMQKPNGKWIILVDEKSCDKPKFRDEIAVTGALERVIRHALRIKNGYTEEELKKPFAFPHIQIDTDKLLADPMTRQAALNNMMESSRAIFGHGTDAPKLIGAEEIPIEEEPEATPQAAPTGSETVDVEPHPVEQKPAEQTRGKPDFKFKDDIPWDEKPEDIARRALTNLIELQNPSAPKGWDTSETWKMIKGLILAMVNNKEAKLEAMNNLIAKTEGWLIKAGVIPEKGVQG